MEVENGGTSFQEWDDRLPESSPEASKHPVEDVNCGEKSCEWAIAWMRVEPSGSQLIRSATSAGVGLRVDVMLQRQLDGVKAQFRILNIRYGLLYPAHPVITHDGQRLIFKSVAEAKDYL
eukprot:superscaffoldBa00000110_g1593